MIPLLQKAGAVVDIDGSEDGKEVVPTRKHSCGQVLVCREGKTSLSYVFIETSF
jgi:hypothetical protein